MDIHYIALSSTKPDDVYKDFFDCINRNRTHLRKWLGWLDITTQPEHTLEFLSNLQKSDMQYRSLTFLMQDISTGHYIGTVGLRDINTQNKTAYIGYWIDSQYQGRGITKNSVMHCIKALQKKPELNVKKIYLQCTLENISSKTLARKTGFIFDCIIPDAETLYGKTHNMEQYIYAL